MTMTVVVKRLSPEAMIPEQMNAGDAGFDLYAIEGSTMEPGERDMISTGLAVAIPEGFAGIIKPRSGLAVRHGINVLAGVIDSGYRGEVKVVLQNTDPYTAADLMPGERIAQLLIVPVPAFRFEEVTGELPETVRGEGGFGSTGAL